MNRDYIPSTDAQYDEWLANFTDCCQANTTDEPRLTPDDVNLIQDASVSTSEFDAIRDCSKNKRG